MNIDPILQAVRQAHVLCREVQHNYLHSLDKFSTDKQDTEPVTIADYGSQALIGRVLQQHFPQDAVLAEEAGSQFLELTNEAQQATIMNLLSSLLDETVSQEMLVSWLDQGAEAAAERTWIIDPIDGTKGFINMRHYAIGVGLVENGQPTGAVMAAPGYGDGVSGDDDEGLLFYIKDGVPYAEGLVPGTTRALRVSERTDDLRIVQSYEKKHASKSRMAAVREYAGMAEATIRELDSMEKYALVAKGDADAYLRLPNRNNQRPHMIWDHAPGVALVLAAGGQVTDVDGSPLDFSRGKTLPNRGMLVSNGRIHDRLVEATQRLLAEEAKA